MYDVGSAVVGEGRGGDGRRGREREGGGKEKLGRHKAERLHSYSTVDRRGPRACAWDVCAFRSPAPANRARRYRSLPKPS